MSNEAHPASEKQIALDALREMPESATLGEIAQELAILDALRRGEDADDAGNVLTHDEVKRRSEAWTSR